MFFSRIDSYLDTDCLFCARNWTYTLALVGLTAQWLAGWQADEIWVDIKVLNSSQIKLCGFLHQCNVIIVLEMYFSQFFSNKAYLRCGFRYIRKYWFSPFSC